MTTSRSTYPNAYRYRRIVRAKRYIDEHFDEPIDLDAMSGEACFSKYHFLRLFKEAYGTTPWQYLAELRVRRAAALLEEDRQTVTEICFMVGFASPGSFSSLFKSVTGSSPARYRNRKRQKRRAVCSQPLIVVPHCFAAAHGGT